MQQAPDRPGNRGGDRELFGEILASVSRSFYLTLRLLPAQLRRPIGLAYLLARASDTLADSPGADHGARLEALARFREAVAGREGVGGEPFEPLRAAIADPAERRLLSLLPALLELLHSSEPGDRDEIRRVLEIIVEGQRLDLERFPQDGVLRALETRAELEDYTYRVAGCVGEFWTRVCLSHLPGYSSRPVEELVRLGIDFGRGLQWVNILRDCPADLAIGRCYLPVGELCQAGLSLEDLREAPAKARPLFQGWYAAARRCLEAGREYREAIRPARLRLACHLPWAIGMRTLARLEQSYPLETPQRVKIPRREVRLILLKGVLMMIRDSMIPEEKFRFL